MIYLVVNHMSSILPCVVTRVKLSCPWIQHTWFTGHWHRGCRKYGQEGPGTGSFASCIAIPGSGKLISLAGCSHEAFVVFRDISCATNASWAHLSSGKLIPLAPDIELRLRALNGFVFLDKPMKINYCRSWFGTILHHERIDESAVCGKWICWPGQYAGPSQMS